MVVQSHVYVVAARGAVHGSQLQFGSLADEAHLLQYEFAVAHINLPFEVLQVLPESVSRADYRQQCQVHMFRHHERLRLLLLAYGVGFGKRLFGLLSVTCLRLRHRIVVQAVDKRHQFIHIGVVGGEAQVAYQVRLFAEPVADVVYFARKREVGVA